MSLSACSTLTILFNYNQPNEFSFQDTGRGVPYRDGFPIGEVKVLPKPMGAWAVWPLIHSFTQDVYLYLDSPSFPEVPPKMGPTQSPFELLKIGIALGIIGCGGYVIENSSCWYPLMMGLGAF